MLLFSVPISISFFVSHIPASFLLIFHLFHSFIGAQLNNPGMQPCSATTVEHACALCWDQARCTCFATQKSPKAVWSRRLRNMQVSLCWWSVNCCVQACKQTQRDTQGRKRAKCARVGDTNNTPPHANWESGVVQTSNRARVWQICEAKRTLEIFLTFKGLAKPQIHPVPATRAELLSARFRFMHHFTRLLSNSQTIRIPQRRTIETSKKKLIWLCCTRQKKTQQGMDHKCSQQTNKNENSDVKFS